MLRVAGVQFDFSDQVVLITGGTKGVGRGLAARFAAAGARIIVCARSTGRGDVAPLPADWAFIAADLRDGDKAWAMVDEAVAVHGRLDVVINNAGGAPPADTSTAPPRFTERVIALNLLAPMYVAQRANHHMQAGDGGSIVNIGSVTANRPSPTAAAYGAAKAGLANFTMTAGQEWAPKVRVNAITAGPILTELAAQHYGDGEQFARVQRTVPLGRLASPDDVADTCMYLASSAASFVTGANLLLHGGGDRPAFLDALDS